MRRIKAGRKPRLLCAQRRCRLAASFIAAIHVRHLFLCLPVRTA
ncbi:hypothetical protein [Treponema endosymbiont of Eucomonympha sp.]|nr:hypothetical protein [Treponema endosymbiont of Eucomonympha sp.]